MNRYSNLSARTKQRIEDMGRIPESYYRIVENLLNNNHNYTEEDVITFLDQFKSNNWEDCFKARLLASALHVGLTYENLQNLSSAECCRIEPAIPTLMGRNLNFEESYALLEGLSSDETELLALELNMRPSLSLHDARNNILNSPFHKKSFLGHPAPWKTSFHHSISWLLPTSIIDFFSWPAMPLTQGHTFLIKVLSKIKDRSNHTPPVKNIIDWVASFNETDAIVIEKLVGNIRTQLNEADLRDVLHEQERWYQEQNPSCGRPARSLCHEPPMPDSKLSLRIEGNQYYGNVLCDNMPDYEKLNPVQVFILATCQRYGMENNIPEQKPRELLEFASGFLGHRIEKDVGNASDTSYAQAMSLMTAPGYTLHEKFISGNIASLKDYAVPTETIHAHLRRQPQHELTFTRAQAVISSCRRHTLYNDALLENFEKVLDDTMSQDNASLNLSVYGRGSSKNFG
jgi:hypothetical protein